MKIKTYRWGRPKKSLGQHFLVNEVVLQSIQEVIDPKFDDSFVEIGAGKGALTRNLIPRLKHLWAIEIDSDLLPALRLNCGNSSKITICHQDARTFLLKDLRGTDGTEKFRICGNLPYCIAAELILHFGRQWRYIDDLHFMVQKEVGERICAHPRTSTYSRLTLDVGFYLDSEILLHISPDAFSPVPAVDSVLIRLKPRQKVQRIDKNLFFSLVKIAFSHRRKKVANNLKQLITSTDLVSLGIDSEARAQDLALQDYLNLTEFLSDSKREI